MSPESIKVLASNAGVAVTIGLVNHVHDYAIKDVAHVKNRLKMGFEFISVTFSQFTLHTLLAVTHLVEILVVCRYACMLCSLIKMLCFMSLMVYLGENGSKLHKLNLEKQIT